jgi:hypothetical protein
MNQTESILLILAVAASAYWLGKRQASATVQAQASAASDPLAWLGSWANA